MTARPTILTFAAAVACASACGGAQRPATHGTAWHQVSFKAAALPARRASGAAWHTSGADGSSTLLGGLLGLAVGYPELGFAIGSAMVGDPVESAPAPYVAVKVAGDTYRIAAIGQTLAPTWVQPIAIPDGAYARKTPVVIQVLDAIDNGVLGQRATTLGELLTPGARTLTDLGEVASLDVEVQPMSPRPHRSMRMVVTGEHTLTELKDQVDPQWAPIPVWNGDRVTIHASEKVCPSSPDECFGPDGAQPGRWRDYAYAGFRDAPHVSLVGLAPDQPIAIGASATFVVKEAGFLLLFVNDRDVDNNTGAFDVTIDIQAR